MNDDLDQKTDAELNETLEREVLCVEPMKLAMASADGGKSGALFESNPCRWESFTVSRQKIEEFCRERPQYSVCFSTATREQYCTTPSAVLPLLASEPGCFKYVSVLGRVTYFKDRHCNHPYFYDGEVSMADAKDECHRFARAGVIALIRAARAAKP